MSEQCLVQDWWENTGRPYFEDWEESIGEGIDAILRLNSNKHREDVLAEINMASMIYRMAMAYCDVTEDDDPGAEIVPMIVLDNFDIKQFEGRPRGITYHIWASQEYETTTINSSRTLGDWMEDENNQYGPGTNFIKNETTEDGWEIDCIVNMPYVAIGHFLYELVNNHRNDQENEWVTGYIEQDIGGWINRRISFGKLFPFLTRDGQDIGLSLSKEMKLMLAQWMSNLGPIT